MDQRACTKRSPFLSHAALRPLMPRRGGYVWISSTPWSPQVRQPTPSCCIQCTNLACEIRVTWLKSDGSPALEATVFPSWSESGTLVCCSPRVALLRSESAAECPTRVPNKSVLQGCSTRVSHKSVLQECPSRVSRKSVPQECPTRVSYKCVSTVCPPRVSHKSVPQGVLQECPARVPHKSVRQEYPTRVSQKCVRQECPTRVSVPLKCWQECPTRVSHKNLLPVFMSKSNSA